MSSASSPYWIGETEGFTPHVGRLVGMLRYARQTTLDAVRGLSMDQLDHLHDARSNSIGMLLAHIAAVEAAYQVETFEGREFTDDERERWIVSLELGESARTTIRGHPLGDYLESLEAVRSITLRRMAEASDQWLDLYTPFWNGQVANNFFKWFHVLEDEVNHRGQIRWLRRRLPS